MGEIEVTMEELVILVNSCEHEFIFCVEFEGEEELCG